MSQTGNLPSQVPKPSETLGYQIIRWCQKYIVHPDGDRAGEPWQFTPEQLRFVLWLYAIKPDGSWKYSAATLRRAKGWGKTPLLAALAIVEFLGPCRFSHWDAFGLPVAKPVPLPVVQIGATALDQCEQTIDFIRGMLSESPAESEYGLEIGKSVIQFKSGKPGSIKPKATAGRTNEGNRPTFIVMDEVHHWVASNGGPDFYQVLKRNSEKTRLAGSRWISTTNAYSPTEDSVAQRIHESEMVSQGFWLYDCVEGPLAVEDLRNAAKVRAALVKSYGDASWADIDGLTQTILYDRTTPDSTYCRFYLNQIAESSDGWMSKSEWDACFSEDDPIEAGDLIACGFDGSIRGDATALVGARLRDAKLFVLGVWERPENAHDDWEVDVLSVEAAVADTFKKYRVAWMYCDPPYWQENIGRWALEHGDDTVFEFWTNKPLRMTQATERFRTAAMVGDLRHDGDYRLTRHVLNAVTREVPQGTLIQKDSPRSRRKIDLTVAGILAIEARADAIADGRMTIRRSRVVGF
ncbi:phage terminase family protein [Streptomyces sp. NBC_00237]|uniref:terminase large subunit n=1 Tax=Streptomyces sp. NBC_00237 TaxID=2975687 RepID=UPI0022511AAF|nr:terminase large subunit [Streptomyces sp. NBC_00237]MCX5201495.1 phage terminase family protein [Streptomyces sp. NBC_00237]